MNWKKSFLLLFIIIVPLLTIINIKSSRFQMFPKFDSTDIKISMKANKNTTLENSFKIIQNIEKDLMKEKNKFFIKSIDSVAGYSEHFPPKTKFNPFIRGTI